MKLTKKEGNFELLNNNGPKHLYIHNIYFKSKNKSQSIQTDVLYFFVQEKPLTLTLSTVYISRGRKKEHLLSLYDENVKKYIYIYIFLSINPGTAS